ncbi:MAG TPA: hypothetical protein VG276_28015 [Actinomycetes bacterium]|jgi:hypothetical protein|nr:hypothetical protein [Actinomycetes bacterium]
MPWRGPEVPGEFPTLGYLIGEWIEANCVIPDGLLQGREYRLTDEMWRFLLRYYRLHPDARPIDVAMLEAKLRHPELELPPSPFFYRGGLLMRAQKWGKGPFAASIILGETFGPVSFDGWDDKGEPVGREQPTPWVQIVATAEEQTDNTWLCVYEMASRGEIANTPGIDIGIEDINLPSGGKIEPRSSSGKSRLGARTTFDLFDETGLMLESNGGVHLATTMKRNIGGMRGRWLETTNAYDPSEQSVAQRTHTSPAEDVLIDYRPPSRRPDLRDDQGCLELLDEVYGDSWWVDRRRILADARDPAVCPTPADALRFFFNVLEVGQSSAVDGARWDSKARPGSLVPNELICLGFDGSRALDLTSLIASRVTDGRWFHLRSWKPSEYPDHRVPRVEVDQAVTDAFDAYQVWCMFGDPYRWQEYFDIWEARWPTRLDGKQSTRVIEFPTNVEHRMDDAITRFLEHFAGGFTHDGDPLLAEHAKAAALAKGKRRQPRPNEDPSIPRFFQRIVKKREVANIDAFVAGLLAEAARGQAIEDGALAQRRVVLEGPLMV